MNEREDTTAQFGSDDSSDAFQHWNQSISRQKQQQQTQIALMVSL